MLVFVFFMEGCVKVILVLWVINFMNLIDLYFFLNWLLMLICDVGYLMDIVVLVVIVLQVGGVIGMFMLGWLIDCLGFVCVLVVCFLIVCVIVGLIGYVVVVLFMLVVVVFVVGFCIVGGQLVVNVLVVMYYFIMLCVIGIGWSLGVGCIGFVIGLVIGG